MEIHTLCIIGSVCCEWVSVEDIIGDPFDLIGTPIIEAEVVTNSNENPEGILKECQKSFTWTFYKLGTKNGHVTIRWYGISNGYYSEEVNFIKNIHEADGPEA